MKKIFAILLGACATLSICYAQKDTGIKAASLVLIALQKHYSNADSSIGFHIRYRYANETTPEKILDSVSGNMTLSHGYIHYILDSTETIQNKDYTIILFRQEKIMYLAKPADKMLKSNPITMMDSLLTNAKATSCIVGIEGKNKILTINFPVDQQYKKIQYIIDTASGLLTHAIMIVKTELMTGSSLAAQGGNLDNYDRYARVDEDFYNYTTERAGTTLFDPKKYFTKNGKDFTVTEQYKDYKIFIGSPNL